MATLLGFVKTDVIRVLSDILTFLNLKIKICSSDCNINNLLVRDFRYTCIFE